MANIFFELDRLRVHLSNKGYRTPEIEDIVQQAKSEIESVFNEYSQDAMDEAISAGVSKNSSDFINELNVDTVNMQIVTDSSNMDFSTPPFPNLHNLLKNAQPIRDGSGVYKVIPLGAKSEKKSISTNIYDAAKRVSAERAESSARQYAKIVPKDSKINFRTATSKQNANTQWVIPAQEKDFTEEVTDINKRLSTKMEEAIQNIIRSYEEGF